MTQAEKRLYLIDYLLKERSDNIKIPVDEYSQRNLLRSLLNIRMPKPANTEFIKIQDEYLKQALSQKGITDIQDLTPVKDGIYIWQGDITTLKCDAIVNAANSQMLGCFCPCHGCIDNAIHTYAGIQLRKACSEIMQEQGHEEPAGQAKITPAYNLPSKYIIHTVGPVIRHRLTDIDCDLLRSCYQSCLEIAVQNSLKSIAFCCISTGEFHFPNETAAKIAVETVKKFKESNDIEVIFNVFKDYDFRIYRELLSEN